MLYEAGRGHAQSHGGIHQPSSIHVDPCSVGVGQEAHLEAKVRKCSEAKFPRGHWAWNLFLKFKLNSEALDSPGSWGYRQL